MKAGIIVKFVGTLVGLAIIYGIYFVIGSSKGVAWISSVGDKTVKTSKFSVDMYGYDGRAYEWPCDKNPDYMCGAIPTSEGIGGYVYPIKTISKGE